MLIPASVYFITPPRVHIIFPAIRLILLWCADADIFSPLNGKGWNYIFTLFFFANFCGPIMKSNGTLIREEKNYE